MERMARLIQRKWRGRSSMLQQQIRTSLSDVQTAVAVKACAGGLDGIARLVSDVLGTNVWQRAIHNAPDEWEEDDMIRATSDALLNPTMSTNVWLLAHPTACEKLLLAAYGGTRVTPKPACSKFGELVQTPAPRSYAAAVSGETTQMDWLLAEERAAALPLDLSHGEAASIEAGSTEGDGGAPSTTSPAAVGDASKKPKAKKKKKKTGNKRK